MRIAKEDVDVKMQIPGATISQLSGRKITLFRPPYGNHNSTVDAAARNAGVAIIIWDVDTEDWKNRSTATTTSRAVSGARSGSIILMHDIHPSTAAAVPGIVAQLRAKGFVLVTVTELLGATTPGKAVFDGPAQQKIKKETGDAKTDETKIGARVEAMQELKLEKDASFEQDLKVSRPYGKLDVYDKVAKLLGFGYPGGPVIDQLAPYGDPKAVRFTLARMKGNTLDFSFSGLKTAVLRWFEARDMEEEVLSLIHI